MNQEQREQLDQLIELLKAGVSPTNSQRNQIIFYLEVLKNFVNRLHGEWEKVK